MTAHERFIAALEAHGCRGRGRDWQCPSHDDRNPSLRVAKAPGTVLFQCMAGCEAPDVLARLGLEASDLYDERREPKAIETAYDYVDETGKLLYQVVRRHPKSFVQRCPDGNGGWAYKLDGVRRVPYRLPQLIEAVRDGRTVYVVEGEKDVHAIEGAGATATTNPGGAGKWRSDFARYFDPSTPVVVVADSDEAGRKHAAQVAESLRTIVRDVRVVQAAKGKDAADHLAAGRCLDELVPVRVEELEAPEASVGEEFNPQPLDIAGLIAEGPMEPEYIERPYVPAGVSVWAAGASESGKSIYWLWTACQLSRRGVRVVIVSQENPLGVERNRLAALRPDPEFFAMYHYQGFDLAEPEHVRVLIDRCQGAALVVLDTLTAVWTGDEDRNAEIAAYDRDVVRPLIAATGACVVTLDHTGHPQAFVSRKGKSAPRGASSKGQKADFLLEFREIGPHEFSIAHAKNRLGGVKEPTRTFQVVETDDTGELDIFQVADSKDDKARELANTMVAIIEASDGISTKKLRQAVTGSGGKDAQSEALEMLRTENPPRVVVRPGFVETEKGRRRANVWKVSEGVRNVSGTPLTDVEEKVSAGVPIGDTRTPSDAPALVMVSESADVRTPSPAPACLRCDRYGPAHVGGHIQEWPS